jgi:hypothetical protein
LRGKSIILPEINPGRLLAQQASCHFIRAIRSRGRCRRGCCFDTCFHRIGEIGGSSQVRFSHGGKTFGVPGGCNHARRETENGGKSSLISTVTLHFCNIDGGISPLFFLQILGGRRSNKPTVAGI